MNVREKRLATIYANVKEAHPKEVPIESIFRLMSLEGPPRETIVDYIQTLADSGQIVILYEYDEIAENNPNTLWFRVRNLRCSIALPGKPSRLKINHGLKLFLRGPHEYTTLYKRMSSLGDSRP